jgi:hypothetical protein
MDDFNARYAIFFYRLFILVLPVPGILHLYRVRDDSLGIGSDQREDPSAQGA